MSDESIVSHIVLASVGNQDLRIKDHKSGKFYAPSPRKDQQKLLAEAYGWNGPKASIPAGARTIGENVFKRLNDKISPPDEGFTFGDLSVPMIRPFLNRVLGSSPLEKVYLIATSQEIAPQTAADLEGREKDTIYIANIIKAMIYKNHPDVLVEIIPLTCNPSRSDLVYKELSPKLRSLHAGTQNPDEQWVSVLATGGTPAITEVLTQLAVGLWSYGQCAVYRATTEPEDDKLLDGTGESEPGPVDMLPVVKGIGRNIMIAQIRSYEYGGARKTLDRLGYQGEFRHIERLLDHAAARLDLRFEDARDPIRAGNGIEAVLRNQIAPFTRSDLRTRALTQIAELVWSAEVRWKQNERVEFLWRAAAIYELALHIIVAQASGQSDLWDSGPYSTEIPIIRGYLERVRPQALESAKFMMECRHWLTIGNDLFEGSSDQRILTYVMELKPVWDRRNKAIHNAVMPTEQEFRDLFGHEKGENAGPVVLKRIVGAIFIWLDYKCDLDSNPYDAVNASLDTELNHVLAH